MQICSFKLFFYYLAVINFTKHEPVLLADIR